MAILLVYVAQLCAFGRVHSVCICKILTQILLSIIKLKIDFVMGNIKEFYLELRRMFRINSQCYTMNYSLGSNMEIL